MSEPCVPDGYKLLMRMDGAGRALVALDPTGERTGLLRRFEVPGGLSSERLAALEQRVAASAEIDHPSLPRVHAVHASGEQLFLFRELFQGEPLVAVLGDPLVDHEALLRIVGQTADAVACLHDRGLAHGDLRPHNVYLGGGTRLYVADPLLGLSPSELWPDAVSPYWAPELVQPGGEVDPLLADVYTLGVLLYEACTRRLPYEGQTRAMLISAFVEGRPIPPRQLNRSLSRNLEAICMRALELSPALRQPNAGSLASEIHRERQGYGETTAPILPVSGDTLAAYRLVDVLGQGGMGVVYRAFSESLQREVALKVLKSESPRANQRFIQEARILADLRHPGIIEILDVGQAEGMLYLTMALAENGTLEQWLGRSRRLPPARALGVLVPVTEALHAAHRLGVVHRDIKPANILFGEEGRPLLTDFGCAKQADRGQAWTSTGMLVGTPHYMAPELVTGERAAGPESDVFSLGCVLYRCLTGVLPFPGVTLAEVLAMLRRSDPVPPRELVPELPRELEEVCLRALSRRLDERYPDAEGLLQALRRIPV